MTTRCVLPRQEAFLSRRRGDRSLRDRGAVTASLLILPAVMFGVLLAIHSSLVLHGRNVANGAAQDAVQAAQLQFATGGNGEQAARNTLAMFPGIRSAQISVTPGLNTVTVTIRGTVETPLDFFNDFEVTKSGPIERFYFESERE